MAAKRSALADADYCTCVREKGVTGTPEVKEHRLCQFVEDNHKLLTALGVFIALTAFSAQLQVKQLGYFLSFLLFVATSLLWIELWTQFPSGESNWRLMAFENVLMMSGFLYVFYCLVEFRFAWWAFLPLVIAAVMLTILSAVAKRLDLFNRAFRARRGQKETVRIVLGILVIAVVLYLSLRVSVLIGYDMNTVLDDIRRDMMELHSP